MNFEGTRADYSAYHVQQCRACLARGNDFHSIFVENVNWTFEELTGLKVSKFDQITLFLCPLCQFQLKSFKDFKYQCISSDVILREGFFGLSSLDSCPDSGIKTIEFNSNSNQTPNEPQNFAQSVPVESVVSFSSSNQTQENSSEPNQSQTIVKDVQEEHTKSEHYCKKCKSNFFDAKQLKLHVKHDHKGLQCDFCLELFDSEKDLTSHRTIHLNSDDSKCLSCGIKFETFAELEKHKKSHETFSCATCQKSFAKKVHLKIHEETHVTEKNFKCSECDAAFNTRRKLLWHKWKHSESEEFFTCPECPGKVFKNSNMLKHHQYMCHSKNNEKFACHICSREYVQKSNLKEHLLSIHSSKERKYKCQKCNKAYASQKILKMHEKNHATDHNFVCDTCGMSYSSRSQLNNHRKKHLERNFICEHCGKAFKMLSNLRTHMSLHMSTWDNQCKSCPAKFKTKYGLRIHQKTHDQERKQWICEQCNKSFTSKASLKTHSVIHSDVKPFKCSVCGQAFNQKITMEKHLHRHQGTRPFNCMFCPRAFYGKGEFRVHMMKAHRVLLQ